MKDKLKLLLDNIYLIAGGLFLILSILGFMSSKSLPSLIAGMTTSVLIIAFHYVFKPKWSEEAKKALEDSIEGLKPFGANLPLQVIGKLQLVFVIIMVVCLFRGILASIIPGFPAALLLVLSNICYALFILGSFYALFQGNIKTFSKTTKIFALYNILEVVFTFVTEKGVVSTKAMCLFLAFYSLSYIFEYMLSEKDPEEGKPVKEKKSKKDKKDKGEEEKVEETKEESAEAPSEDCDTKPRITGLE